MLPPAACQPSCLPPHLTWPGWPQPFVEMLKEEPLLSYREREPAKVAQMLQFAVNLMNDR